MVPIPATDGRFRRGGIGRLVDAVERGAAPASAFRGLAGGKVTESIQAADLSRLLRGIAQLPDGYAVATEILSMHFLGQSPSSGWDRSVIECGHDLLAQYPLEQAKDRQSCDYELSVIAKTCLRNGASAEHAKSLCRRIRQASERGLLPTLYVNDLVAVLLELHPNVALDVWLAEPNDQWWQEQMCRHGLVERNPLEIVPTTTLQEWAERDPFARYPRLARSIQAVTKHGGSLA